MSLYLTLQEIRLLPAELEGDITGDLGAELPADLAFRGRGPKNYQRIKFPPENPTIMSGTEWKKWEGKLPAEFSPNNSAGNGILQNAPFQYRQWLRAPIRTSKSPPSPFSVEPHPNLRSPPVVFSIRVYWRRHGDVAAATTTVEPVCLQPPSEYLEDRTSKARTTAVLPRSPVLAVLPGRPVFRPCHSFSPSVQLQPPLKAQGTVLTEFNAAQRFVLAPLRHHHHREVFNIGTPLLQILQGNVLNSLLIQVVLEKKSSTLPAGHVPAHAHKTKASSNFFPCLNNIRTKFDFQIPKDKLKGEDMKSDPAIQSNVKQKIAPDSMRGLLPKHNNCTKEITSVIKLMYDKAWPNWKVIPAATWARIFDKWAENFTWEKRHDELVKAIFNTRASKRFSGMMEGVRDRKEHLTQWCRPELKKALYHY
ncbi:hypothetical protein PIB30_045391 [Stylosanthes scabra]|uniref:Uncharacterized protein n=1 Tax=Stylosanthes scabra TaxID=79078 RepID=A0ABU6VGV4_9FABA|nr:hypothetical protein [Stylosanthes scabra]